MVCQFFAFFSLNKIFYMSLKCRTTFLKSRRFFRHPYQAIICILGVMAIMAIMAIIAENVIMAILAITTISAIMITMA